MNLIIQEQARAEFRESAIFYDEVEAGLGFEFIDEINNGFDSIKQHPEAWPLIYEDVRAFLVKRFSFRIFYCFDADEIVVVGISHCARKPYYWIDRLI